MGKRISYASVTSETPSMEVKASEWLKPQNSEPNVGQGLKMVTFYEWEQIEWYFKKVSELDNDK